MKFVCLGFIEESKYESLTEAEGRRMMEECFAYDDELRRGGHFLGGKALQSVRNAVTLRIKNGSVDVTDGPYAETKEMLGGILLLEARDLNHAIALMSQHPGVKAGPFEIRPADEETNKLIAARNVTLRSDPTTDHLQSSPCSTLRAALNFSYEWIKPLAEDLADSPMISPTPTHGNHPLWIMGHLVFSSAGLLSMISGGANPFGEWREMFSGGTTPQIDGAIYPDYADVLQAYERVHQDVLHQFDNLPASRLGERPPAVWEEVRDNPHFQTIGQLFLFIAMHEMSHRGQLADARNALGRKPFA
jgi:hypothetical protein